VSSKDKSLSESVKTCDRGTDDPASTTCDTAGNSTRVAMTAQHFDVLIIGAGLSGIGTACHVTAEHPNKTIAILERRQRLGGTWDLFRYPGVRSDSDMYTFGFGCR
jgi:NAD(P)-binding Rossmann-like domain